MIIVAPTRKLRNLLLREKITPLEAKIMQLIVEGKSAKKIAELTFRAKRTIDGYRSTFMSEFEVDNISQLIVYLIAHKYFTVTHTGQ